LESAGVEFTDENGGGASWWVRVAGAKAARRKAAKATEKKR
jgi:hypothetical protein